MATRKNLIKVVEQLLQETIFDKHDECPEDYIINAGLPHARTKEMALFYLEQNCDPNVGFDRECLNCLANAVKNDDIELIDILLEHGASPFASDPSIGNTLTAISCALEKMEKEDPLEKEQGKQILLKFVHYSNTSENLLMYITLEDDVSDETKAEAISCILEKHKIDIDEQDDEGMTVLMTAAKNMLYNVVKVLLKQNPNVLLTNEDGYTAIDLAEKELSHQNHNFWWNSKEKVMRENTRRMEVGPAMLELLKRAYSEQIETVSEQDISKYFNNN